MSSKTPIYENLIRPTSRAVKHPLQQHHPALHHPALHNPALHHPVSSLHHPVSNLHHPVSSLHHPLHPISNVQHPILSSLQHPFSHHPLAGGMHPLSGGGGIHPPPSMVPRLPDTSVPTNQAILANPLMWQSQQLAPPSGNLSFYFLGVSI